MSFTKFTHLLDPIGRTLSLSMKNTATGGKTTGAPIINGHWNIGWTPKNHAFPVQHECWGDFWLVLFLHKNFQWLSLAKQKNASPRRSIARTPVPRSTGVPVGASRCRSSTPDAHPRSASIQNSGCYAPLWPLQWWRCFRLIFCRPSASSSPYTVQESIMWGIISEAVICLSFQTESPLPV